MSTSARYSALSQKKVELTFKECRTPEPSVSFIDQFKANTAAVTKSANTFFIDVFPDFVPILMYIFFNCWSTIEHVDKRNHGKVTAPTYVLYCLTIVYGHFLISDAFIRQNASPAAQDYKSCQDKRDFLDLLLTLPVPAFLEPIIKQFYCTTTERTKNVFFCPSAAGVTHSTHFGRFFPINFLSTIHDFVAEMDSRSDPKKAIISLFSQTVYTIANTTSTTYNLRVAIGHLFGASFRTTDADFTSGTAANRTVSDHKSVLRQMFDNLFNPVLSRDYTRRQNLVHIGLTAPVFTDAHFNPYDALFAYSPHNFVELPKVLNAVAAVVNGAIPCTKTLAQMYESPSGVSILQHGYSTFNLPTWHASTTLVGPLEISEITANPVINKLEPEAIAAQLKFLVLPDWNAAAHTTVHTLPSATAVCNTDNAHLTTVTVNQGSTDFQLLRNVTAADPPNHMPQLNAYVEFDALHDVAPLVNGLNPTEADLEEAWKITAFGMVIQSFEIDASAVPQPNAEIALASQNARFMESAVPYFHTHRATTFHGGNLRHIVRRRANETRNNFKVMNLLVDYSRIYIPRPILATADALVNNGFPGLTFLNNVTWFTKTQSALGYKTASSSNPRHADRHAPNTHSALQYVFSPYTYTPVFGDFDNNNARLGYYTSPYMTYYLVNLRTLFGTDPNLMELQHAFKAMPIS